MIHDVSINMQNLIYDPKCWYLMIHDQSNLKEYYGKDI